MRHAEQHGEWKLEVETVAVEHGMFTCKATISRKRMDGLAGHTGYAFKNVGVVDSTQGAVDWAAEWLRGWIDDNT
jgi:hypothetical protein